VNCCSCLATVLIHTIHAAFSAPPARTLFHLREITAWRSGSDSTAGKITSANRFSISATSTGDICPSPTHFVLYRDSGFISLLNILHVGLFQSNVPTFALTLLLGVLRHSEEINRDYFISVNFKLGLPVRHSKIGLKILAWRQKTFLFDEIKVLFTKF